MSDTPREPTVSTALARPFISLLRAKGFDLDTIEKQMGVDLKSVDRADGRLPHRRMLMLMEGARLVSGDPLLGLHAGGHLSAGDMDLVEYVAASGATAGEAIRTTGRYLHLLADAFSFTLTVEGDLATWTLSANEPDLLPPTAADYAAGCVATIARRVLGIEGADSDVVAILLPHAALGDVEEYERTLPAPVRFEQGKLAVVLRTSMLQRPMRTADPALQLMLERHAETLGTQQPQLSGFAEDVRSRITEELRGGNPSAEHIASNLAMSSRTLHRRLKDQGTTFKDLLDETRRQLALVYLADAKLSIGEVAYLLGFSAASAFHRAFKRWQNGTPQEYRDRLP